MVFFHYSCTENHTERQVRSLLFDFDRFTISAKLAYRRCEGCVYSLEDVLQVFRYYFETYEMIFDTAHPMINIVQIASIIERMPFVFDDGMDITPDGYKVIIDQHFTTKYRQCDYNINHFFSGHIRELRYYETLY